MSRLANALEELMGATPAVRPNIQLKNQQPGMQTQDPQKAGDGLSKALAGAGGAIQNAIDARVNDQARRTGDPDMATQHAQSQPPRATPQARLQQQQDEMALKKGKLPKDLDKDVANVAMQSARNATNRAGTPPMESIKEAKTSKAVMPTDLTAANPDDVQGYEKMTDAQKQATAKHKSQLKGDGPDKISHMGRDGAGNPKKWQALTPGKLKSVPQPTNEDAADGDGEAPTCPTCGGDGKELGGLGNTMHYRCSGCGMNFTTSAKPKKKKKVAETVLTDEERQTILDDAFG